MKSASIFEAQVVFTPAVQKMSLWAKGMPVSGPPSPRASCWSARSAAASAIAGSTLMKLFRSPSAASMRASAAAASSRLLTSRARSARPSSVMVLRDMETGSRTPYSMTRGTV